MNKLESTPPEFAFAQVTVFWPICFLSRRFFKDFVLLVYIPMYTFDPTLEATPPKKDRKKREPTLPEDDSRQIIDFLARWISRRKDINKFNI